MSEIKKGYYFEAMDRCHTLMIMTRELLDEHPAIIEEKLQKDIDNVMGILMKCYQKIGENDKAWE